MKGNVTRKQFWGLYKELVVSEDKDHYNRLLEVVSKLTPEQQINLAILTED